MTSTGVALCPECWSECGDPWRVSAYHVGHSRVLHRRGEQMVGTLLCCQWCARRLARGGPDVGLHWGAGPFVVRIQPAERHQA